MGRLFLRKHSATRVERVAVDPRAVFLNIPYDARFQKLYLAYLAGIVSFGLKPKVALEVPGGIGRLLASST